MAVKRQPKQNPGIQMWVVTFGDMMKLLLCFFILLQMFSELKRDREYQRVVTAIKEAFGYSGGVGVLPIDDPPIRSMIERLEQMAVRQYEETKTSQSPTQSIDGVHARVKKVREGLVFTIGGPSTFDEFSAEVKPSVREELEKLSILLAGRTNKIVIRGHAAARTGHTDRRSQGLPTQGRRPSRCPNRQSTWRTCPSMCSTSSNTSCPGSFMSIPISGAKKKNEEAKSEERRANWKDGNVGKEIKPGQVFSAGYSCHGKRSGRGRARGPDRRRDEAEAGVAAHGGRVAGRFTGAVPGPVW